ncbi:MAG: flavin reductase family protein [Desulfurococcales archaeon]|nr:flavin reductase family protein [Desulfurococcales archaeon]
MHGFTRLKNLEEEKFYLTLHPSPTIVVVTKCPGNRFNAMPASWNVPLSEEPPAVGVAIDRETYTFECLEHHPEASLNVPGPELVDLVYSMGTVSGRDVDKIREFKVKLVDSETVSVPRWADAIASLEGKVWKYMDVGEVRFYAFRILAVHVREGLYTRWGWDFSKTNILLHGAGRAFYLVGRRVFARKPK